MPVRGAVPVPGRGHRRPSTRSDGAHRDHEPGRHRRHLYIARRVTLEPLSEIRHDSGRRRMPGEIAHGWRAVRSGTRWAVQASRAAIQLGCCRPAIGTGPGYSSAEGSATTFPLASPPRSGFVHQRGSGGLELRVVVEPACGYTRRRAARRRYTADGSPTRAD